MHLPSAVTDRGRAALEGAFHRKVEKRTNELIALVEIKDRRGVPVARVDDAIERVAAVEHIIDSRPDGHPEYILVLDEEAGNGRDVLRAVNLCGIVIFSIMIRWFFGDLLPLPEAA